ncbi:MspA family porin [Rhodococcus sp. AG1013]|jgi:MspA|uniref:MspA family porin n=1 Tax=unclassified Rhodococcus (in: high G+C Gram-positive bacteria) TaxID=192944 RepID=UPI000E0AEEC6|nr:MspA family porin [Rhodococcus sp. AG1013]RDI21811.1 MspA protein [Rhodococcus sp. AG1013]
MNSVSIQARPRRSAAWSAAALLPLAAALALVTSGAAEASERTAPTPAGTLTVTLANDVVEPVPGLTLMPTSREGLVSISAVATATGAGSQDITSGNLDVGYQVGCAVDVSGGVQLAIEMLAGPAITFLPTPGLGMNFGVGPSILINPKLGTSQDVSLGKQVSYGPESGVSLDAARVKIDGCLGDVTIRPYAVYTVTTDRGSHSVATYGTSRLL